MMNYEFGDVLIAAFPTTAPRGFKRRPVVMILDIGDDDIVVVPITSTRRNALGDFRLSGWKSAGLRAPSWVRLAKVTFVLKDEVARRLGRLTHADRRLVVEAWASIYALRTR